MVIKPKPHVPGPDSRCRRVPVMLTRDQFDQLTAIAKAQGRKPARIAYIWIKEALDAAK